jgi:hypothetical protein
VHCGFILRDAARTRLLRMRARKVLRARFSDLWKPHPEEPAVGGRLEGWGVLRRESSCKEAMSPRMNASFFARLHFLILRSFSIASVIRSNHCENTSSTGLRACVSSECSGVVLSDPNFQRRTSRSDVIAAVGTPEDIKAGSVVHCEIFAFEASREARPHDEVIDAFVNSDASLLAAILRDAAKTPLLRMRASCCSPASW